MKKFLEYGSVAAIGAIGYSVIEILWRGHTHFSMTLTGGLCMPLIYKIHADKSRGLIHRSLICSGIITLIEFAVGCIVNLALKLNVWDYSKMHFNLLGQICLLYSLLWTILSAFICPVCNVVRKYFR